jgi:transcriptional regulator with XRE-family HTH domain
MEAVRKSTKLKLNSQENVLKQLRKALGYTQREFAFALNTTHRTLVRYELGQRDPVLSLSQIKKLQLLLFKLGLDFQDLPDDWNIQIKIDRVDECQKEKVGAK